MHHPELGIYLSIISAHRPGNVKSMQALLGIAATWYVPKDEEKTYKEAGAKYIVPSGGLVESRNKALNDAWDTYRSPCFQLSDDLKHLHQVKMIEGKKRAVPFSFSEAASLLLSTMKETEAYLGGVAPTDSIFYCDPEKPIGTKNFVVGDCILVRPCGLYFDTRLSLKEDYDYTMQHLTKYGCVARRNDFLFSFLHRTNAGGAVSIRTPEREQQNISVLQQKWNGCIIPNKRRPNEVLLRWKKEKAIANV